MAEDNTAGGAEASKERDLSLPISVGLFLVLGAGLWLMPQSNDVCADGMLTECTAQSFAAWQERRDPKALEQLEANCEWYKPACRRLFDVAQLLDKESGDASTVERYYGIACEAENFAACEAHGHLKLKQGQASEAAAIFKAACVERHAPACDALRDIEAQAAAGKS